MVPQPNLGYGGDDHSPTTNVKATWDWRRLAPKTCFGKNHTVLPLIGLLVMATGRDGPTMAWETDLREGGRCAQRRPWRGFSN